MKYCLPKFNCQNDQFYALTRGNWIFFLPVPFSGWLEIVCKDPTTRFDVNLTISSPCGRLLSRLSPLFFLSVQRKSSLQRIRLRSALTWLVSLPNTTAPRFICCQPLQVIHLEEICIHHCIFKLTK